jgi:hypothetical protein
VDSPAEEVDVLKGLAEGTEEVDVLKGPFWRDSRQKKWMS